MPVNILGKIFAGGLKPQVAQVAAWDLKFEAAVTADTQRGHAEPRSIGACGSLQELGEPSELVIFAITASNTLAGAKSAASFLLPGALFLDLNSA